MSSKKWEILKGVDMGMILMLIVIVGIFGRREIAINNSEDEYACDIDKPLMMSFEDQKRFIEAKVEHDSHTSFQQAAIIGWLIDDLKRRNG